MPTEPASDATLASSNRHEVANFPDLGSENTTRSLEILEMMASDSTVNDEIVRLTSSNAFDACKEFNISSATVDEISLMIFIPKCGVIGAVYLARAFGWSCERAERTIVAYFRGTTAGEF